VQAEVDAEVAEAEVDAEVAEAEVGAQVEAELGLVWVECCVCSATTSCIRMQ
jgi:hypothetical protein